MAIIAIAKPMIHGGFSISSINSLIIHLHACTTDLPPDLFWTQDLTVVALRLNV